MQLNCMMSLTYAGASVLVNGGHIITVCENKSRAVAGMAARCRCKFRYISKFTASSRGFHCDSNAFELNESPD